MLSNHVDNARDLLSIEPGSWSGADHELSSRTLAALRSGHRRRSPAHTYVRRALRRRRDAEARREFAPGRV